MSETLECAECKATYHHSMRCSLRNVPLPVWPMRTTPEVNELVVKALITYREKLAGLVEGLMGCQEVSDDFNTWLFYSPTGELLDRTEVLNIIRTTEIGE